MRCKGKKISEDIILISLREDDIIRYIAVGKDYEISYEVYSLIADENFNEKEFLKDINVNSIRDTLDDINNSMEDDCLYHDIGEIDNINNGVKNDI